MPKIFARFSRSSALVTRIAIIEKIGVVATITEARPPGIMVWPQTIRPAEMRLLNRPMPVNDSRLATSLGTVTERARA
jgi:hypothetical protein